MLKLEGLLGVVVLGLYIFCAIDVIATPEQRVRSLPKLAWVFIVLLFPLAGSIAWLAVGRPLAGPAPASPRGRATSAYPEYDRPGRYVAANPDDDEDFLRRVRERAEEQRRHYRESRPADPAASDGSSAEPGPVSSGPVSSGPGSSGPGEGDSGTPDSGEPGDAGDPDPGSR